MEFTNLYLNTFWPMVPQIVNGNFQAVSNYFDVLYDASKGILLKPVVTTGLIKGTTGEFVNVSVDNLVVKNQFTNVYANVTTADWDFYQTAIGQPTLGRDASATMNWWETDGFKYIDVNKPYYKLMSDTSIALNTKTISQIVELIFDVSAAAPFDVKMNYMGDKLHLLNTDASIAWVKLICIGYDASHGPTWKVMEYGGTFSFI